MRTWKRLDRIYEAANRIPINDSDRLIFMSDCHRGDGSNADDFFKNENLYLTALNHYYNKGFKYIEIGDGDELWENKKFSEIIDEHLDVFLVLRKFYQDNRLHFIYGNHDMVKRSLKFLSTNFYRYYDKRRKCEIPLFENITVHEGLVLEYHEDGNVPIDKDILLVHGHQVDDLNSSVWKFSRFLVRYFWKPLELFGISNPTSPAQNQEKKEKIGKRLTEWVVNNDKMLIAGHNHRPMFPELGEPLYFNDGSCVHPLFITGIEIDQGKISLIKWGIKVRKNGLLYVGRDVIAGPKALEDFFVTKRIYSSCSLKDPE